TLARARERGPRRRRRRARRPGKARQVLDRHGSSAFTAVEQILESIIATPQRSEHDGLGAGGADLTARTGAGAGPGRALGAGRLRRLVSAVASDSFRAFGTSAALLV